MGEWGSFTDKDIPYKQEHHKKYWIQFRNEFACVEEYSEYFEQKVVKIKIYLANLILISLKVCFCL